MKAIRVIDGSPTLVDAPPPADGDVMVDIVAASICGSDLHMIDGGMAEGRVLGHEFAGITPDGTSVAVEPIVSCGHCVQCVSGSRNHCHEGASGFGIFLDGGMAERISVPAEALVALPSGLSIHDASLVEPLAVAVHAVRRARVGGGDRVAVVGAGPIGLAVAAVCVVNGVGVHIEARHPHQQAAAERIGATVGTDGKYDVVFDAVASTESIAQSIRLARVGGRVGLVGTIWSPASLDMAACLKEVEIIPSMMYGRTAVGRDVDSAAAILARNPAIAEVMITQRFPLDAAAEAFDAARSRSDGTIKVVFEPQQ